MKLFKLIKTLYFKKFLSEFDISSLNFSFMYKNIVKIAFIWHKLLSLMLINEYVKCQSYAWIFKSITVNQQMFEILSTLCHSCFLKNFNFFVFLITMYLHDSEIKCWVVKTLFNFEICHNYDHDNELIWKIVNVEKILFQFFTMFSEE